MYNGTLIYSWSLIHSWLSLDLVSLSMVRQSRRDSLQASPAADHCWGRHDCMAIGVVWHEVGG